MLEWPMSLRGASLLVVLLLGACSGSAGPSAKKPEAMAANINPEMVRQYSRFLQQYISALLLCGSTAPADWEEAKRQFDLIHPFFVFNEDPGLISDFKAGSVTARQELARRGAMLQSILVLSSGVYDREKWDNARKVLMDAGEPGQ